MLAWWPNILTVRHNDLCDIIAESLSKVCNDIAIEPPLQSLSGEVINPQSANQQDMPQLTFMIVDSGVGSKVLFF